MLLTLNVKQRSRYTSNTDNQTLIHNRPTQLSKTITQQYNVPALWLKYSYNPNLKLVYAECTYSLSLSLSVCLSVCLSLALALSLSFTHHTIPHRSTSHHTHTYTLTYTNTHTHIHTHTHTHTYTHTYTHTLDTWLIFMTTSPEDEERKMSGIWESLLFHFCQLVPMTLTLFWGQSQRLDLHICCTVNHFFFKVD